MNDSLISVIIPTYNYGNFLGETLTNILEQSYENWECLIVDDGSTDNTKEVVQNFSNKDKRFKYLYQAHRGPSAARNKGLRNSKGAFIQLLDSDDKIETHKLKFQVRELLADPSIDIIYGGVRYFNTKNPNIRHFDLDGKLDKSWMPEISGNGWDILPYLITNNIMVINAPVFRSSIIQKIGYFDEELGAVEDWDFWLRGAMKNIYFKYLCQPETFALVRTHISLSRNVKLMNSSTLQLRYKINDLLKELGKDEDLKLNKKLAGDLYNELISQDIEKGLLYPAWEKTIRACLWSDNLLIRIKDSFKFIRKYIKKIFFHIFK